MVASDRRWHIADGRVGRGLRTTGGAAAAASRVADRPFTPSCVAREVGRGERATGGSHSTRSHRSRGLVQRSGLGSLSRGRRRLSSYLRRAGGSFRGHGQSDDCRVGGHGVLVVSRRRRSARPGATACRAGRDHRSRRQQHSLVLLGQSAGRLPRRRFRDGRRECHEKPRARAAGNSASTRRRCWSKPWRSISWGALPKLASRSAMRSNSCSNRCPPQTAEPGAATGALGYVFTSFAARRRR